MKLFVTIYQDEDRIFIADCPSIPGCVSQGRALGEAEKDIQKAIKACLEVRAERSMLPTLTVSNSRSWFDAGCANPGWFCRSAI